MDLKRSGVSRGRTKAVTRGRPREAQVELTLFSGRRAVMLEQQTRELIYRRKLGKVASVCACRSVDEPYLFPDSVSRCTRLATEPGDNRRSPGTGELEATYVPDRKRNIML